MYNKPSQQRYGRTCITIGNEYLLSDVVYPDYYLTIMFDEKGRVFMISYQKNQKYELL